MILKLTECVSMCLCRLCKLVDCGPADELMTAQYEWWAKRTWI